MPTYADLLSREHEEALDAYFRAHTYGSLCKRAGDPELSYSLSGRLYISRSGWCLLSVPNAVVNGLFDALDESGAELPVNDDGRMNAHISVMNADEVKKIGGPAKISERGHSFHYTLGPIKSVVPSGWAEMSRVWYVEVNSPELKELRRSYGLTPLPHNGDYDFHITFACRRKGILGSNTLSKVRVNESTSTTEPYPILSK